MEEGSGAGANGGQDIKLTQQTHSQTEAAILNKETLNKEEKTERPEETWPDTQETRVTYPYSVLLASYRVVKNAQRALAIYREIGLSVFWVRVDLGDDNVWYRVFTGHFRGREEAEAFIKEKGLVEARSKKIRYANLVGVYTSENALNAKLLELSRLGYCQYIIKGIKGTSQLYVGAFYTRQGAETQRSEL
ncbi:MAG: SPOR domain-containing protein, partial [Desulfobacteraceae bacterium]|nr:SPOR domain-containing protein [Desulfobacteraceae bacterium]